MQTGAGAALGVSDVLQCVGNEADAVQPVTAAASVIAALVWGVAAGFLARAAFGAAKPGVPITLVAGFGGSVLGFLVTHELLGLHEMHLFAPEGLLPAAIGALVLLLVAGRLRRAARHKTTFG